MDRIKVVVEEKTQAIREDQAKQMARRARVYDQLVDQARLIEKQKQQIEDRLLRSQKLVAAQRQERLLKYKEAVESNKLKIQKTLERKQQ